jgi:diguanylate cyclase (GGDEF)-like protein
LISEPAEATLDSLGRALNLVNVGIILLNHDLRVRFINRRQVEMFGLPPGLLAGGPRFRDLLDHAAAKGWFSVAEDELPEYLDYREAAVRDGSVPPTEISLQDGRRLLFSCAPCPDGGRILTYADISQELQREADDAAERVRAEVRFQTEMLEDHAASLASLAEETDESARSVEAARLGLEQKIVEHRHLEVELRRLATTDGLTGALNRTGFMASAQHQLEQGESLAVLMLDIDHFKAVNDRYGHAGGDFALQHLVATLRIEAREGDLLGRLGGEEFAVVIPVISAQAAVSIAERLRCRVAAEPLEYGDIQIALTVSIGLATQRVTDRSIDQIIARADAALYQAKANGRNRVMKEPDSSEIATFEQAISPSETSAPRQPASGHVHGGPVAKADPASPPLTTDPSTGRRTRDDE